MGLFWIAPVKSSSRVLAFSEVYAKWAGNWLTEQSSIPGFPLWGGQALLCVATCTNSHPFLQPFFLFKVAFRFRACLPWSQQPYRVYLTQTGHIDTDVKLPMSAHIGLFRVHFQKDSFPLNCCVEFNLLQWNMTAKQLGLGSQLLGKLNLCLNRRLNCNG